MYNFKEMVLDIQIAENLGKKYMYYNTYRPSIPDSRKIRMPFFGACCVHRVHKEGEQFRLTVEIEIKKAKAAIVAMVKHLSKLDEPTTETTAGEL